MINSHPRWLQQIQPLFIMALVSGYLSSCVYLQAMAGFGPKSPKISIEEVEFSGLTKEALKLNLRLKVFNPNDFDLELSNTIYNITVSEKKFAHGEYKGSIIAVKEAYSLITIPVEIDLKSMGDILRKSILTGKKPIARWQIDAVFEGPIGGIDVNFTDEKPLY